MTSHEYAKAMQHDAELLLSKPEFTVGSTGYMQNIFFWGDREGFLAAVRATGSGTKEWKDDDLKFKPRGSNGLSFYISRSAVCRKVQDEKWECEPLLSEDEVAAVGG